MNKQRDTSWRPIVVFSDNGKGVEKHGMTEIFENERALADCTVEVPEDVVVLDPALFPVE
jgi:hypothetical protein